MDINTKEGFKEAVKECLTELLTQSPILKQTDVGGADTPICLVNGLLSACSNVVGVSDFNNARNTGYIKLTNGLIIQWGALSVTGSATVTFPLSYTRYDTYQAVCTYYGGNPEVILCISKNDSDSGEMTIYSNGNKDTVMWITIGI